MNCFVSSNMFVSFASFFIELLVFRLSSLTVLTGIFWVLIIRSNSSLICLYFSSVHGVRARADSSSRLSPPLFSLLLNVWRPVRGEQWPRAHGETEKEKEKEVWEGLSEMQVLTHILCLLIMCRSISSLILRYLSSDSGLWPPSRLRRGLGCHSHLDPSFSGSVNTSLHTVQIPTTMKALGWVTYKLYLDRINKESFLKFENHSCRAHFRIWGKLSQNNYV